MKINRRHILWIIFPIVSTVVSFLFSLFAGKTWYICPKHSEHYNLISVNAIFGGFLYTNYSLLTGIMNNSAIKELVNTSIIEKRNNRILHGILMSLASILAALYLIFIPDGEIKCKEINAKHLLYLLMQNAEVIFMIYMIVYFVLSVVEMNRLIGRPGSEKKSESDINALRDEIMNSKNNDSSWE